MPRGDVAGFHGPDQPHQCRGRIFSDLRLAKVEDWSLNGPGAELPDQDRAWLLVQLG
jgi:hypothetical protein